MKTPILAATTIALVALLAGCANSSARYEPIVDGARDGQYFSDLGACQNLAEERRFINGDTKSEAILGAAVGGVLGAIEDGGEGAVAGAVVGGALGGAGRAWETRDERRQIVIQCMSGRGHRVVG